MASLVYLNFLVTCLACVEEKVTRVTESVYDATKMRLPSLCNPSMLRLYHCTKAVYTTTRNWICETAHGPLTSIDDMIGGTVSWTERKFPRMCERCATVQKFCKGMAARIAEAWQNHGLLLGTFVIISALLLALFSLLSQIWCYPFVQERVRAVEKSEALNYAKAYYEKNIEQSVMQTSRSIKNTIQLTGETVSTVIGLLREAVLTAIEILVGSTMYKRFYFGVKILMKKLMATEIFRDVILAFEPFISPIWNKISSTKLYGSLVELFTPTKDE